MAVKFITIYPYNILEDGSFTVTGTPDTGFLEQRLADRCQGVFWKKTGGDSSSSCACEIKVDQGATTIKDVDALIIPKHNFDQEMLEWQYSNDNFVSDINPALDSSSWTQSGNGQILKELSTPVNSRYWRVLISEMDLFRCSEVYMSAGYDFNVKVDPYPVLSDRPNVDKRDSVGGMTRTTKLGDKRRARQYHLQLDSNDMADWNEAIEFLDNYSKPFFIKDHAGDTWLASFISTPNMVYLGEDKITDFVINLIEEL